MYLSHLIANTWWVKGQLFISIVYNIICFYLDEYKLSCIHFFVEVFNINSKDNLINEQIRAKEMMVIGPNGEQLGVKSRQDALTLASYAGFDLVLMSEGANPPVCKIMDYNRFKYEKKKKAKEAQKKQREAIVDIKEFRLSVTIDKHDFETRVTNAKKALQKGDKVKASIRFKGRQIAHPELAQDVLKRFEESLSDVAEVEIQPKLEGRSMFMQLTPKK